jgi:histidinol-phosphate aminotransferase
VRLFERVAIAGAGRGIGEACARALAARGTRELWLCARTASELEATARDLSARFPAVTVRAVPADLATDRGARAFAAAAGAVDLAIVAAGSAHRAVALDEATRDTLLAQLESNALAPALAGGALLRAGAKQLLFLSSLATRRPPMPGAAPYTASKAALEAFVRAFAEECWPRARANALCLGPVRTRLHELAGTPPEWVAQFPSPDEVAPLVLALASAGVTGRIVDADALAQDPAAALAGDGRLAQAERLVRDGEEHAEPEPGRRPSPRVRGAIRKTAAEAHRYPAGTEALTDRIAQLHGVPSACIALSGGGASELLERTLRVFCSPGDEVVSPFPTFELLSALCSREGLRHRPVPARRDPSGLFGPHSAAPLQAAIGPRTRLLYIASPDNPTGAVLSAAEEALLPADLPVVIDEAWAMEPPQPASQPLRALRLRSLSKLHGLAGLRIGYALGPAEWIELLRRLELPFPLGAPQLAAALAALAEPERARRSALLLRRERARLASALRAHGLAVSESPAPILLVRGPAVGRLLFALQAARLPVQQAHWDESALVLGVGSRAQNVRALAAVARALGGG